MEITSCQSLSDATKLPKPLNYTDSSPSPAFFPSTTSVLAYNSVNFVGFNCLPRKLKYSTSARRLRNFGAIHASDAQSSSTEVAQRWVLEPVGDGDRKHIGYKIGKPGAFEIVSNAITVGRVPEKADVVLPVPTGIEAH